MHQGDADAALAVLAEAVRQRVAVGDLHGDVSHITRVLWSAAHGAVSPELARPGPEPLARSRFGDAIHAAAGWFSIPRRA